MPTHKTFKAKTRRAGTLKAVIAACGLALMGTSAFDGKTLMIYKDSQAIKSEAISLEDAENIVRVGAPGPWDTAKPFAGKIAGFAIWNRALSQPEIQALGADTPKN